jgi:putative restriction endonuclease
MNYAEMELDREVRLAAFAFLQEQFLLTGELIAFQILSKGFQFKGKRVPLVGPQGIFKPGILPEIPLTIMTAPEKPGKPRPYDDRPAEQGIIVYRYRGIDPLHPDNVGLRKAMMSGIPLVYLYGVARGLYKPIWPCFIIEDHPENLSFHVMADDIRTALNQDNWILNPDLVLRRRYITVEVQRRLHQETFRTRVLHAYHNSCAICRLRHPELLEAAHILEDKHPRGIPAVSNGLSL